MHKLFPLSAVLVTLGVIACGNDDGSGPSNGGSGGSGNTSATGGSGGSVGGTGGTAPLVCDTDYDRIASDATAVSFQAEVMPIFQRACTQTQCHCNRATNPRCAPTPKAGLFLGVQSSSPVATDPVEVAGEVHANLVGVASTTAPAVPRIAANDPAGSFLIQKISDTHDDQGHTCTPQDDAVTGCGDPMPPGGPTVTLCTQGSGGQEEFDLIARWVAQGAQNN